MIKITKLITTSLSLFFSCFSMAYTPIEVTINGVDVPEIIVENHSKKSDDGIELNFSDIQEFSTNTFSDSLLAAQFDSLKNTIPSYMVYEGAWDNDKLNSYRIHLDSIMDSVNIDCSDFVYPTKSNRVTSNFGVRWSRFHYGIDLGVRTGDTIRSAFSGKVRLVNYERRGYGRYLVVRHDNGFETLYAHMSRTLVEENEIVEAGEPIGLGGNTGHSTGPHLHFEVRYQGNPFNPNKLIDFNSMTARVGVEGNYFLSKANTYSHKTTLAKMKEARYCRVKPGDTLSHIARRYGTSVARLCKLNRIGYTSILQIGQKMRYR